MPKRHDELIKAVRENVEKTQNHDHEAGHTADYFCFNLVAWIGEQADGILDHIDYLEDVVSKVRAWMVALRDSTEDGLDERSLEAGHAVWMALMDEQDSPFKDVPEAQEAADAS
jgi:hypothetical protein